MPGKKSTYVKRKRVYKRKPVKRNTAAFKKRVQSVIYGSTEPKYTTDAITGQSVGQVNADLSGHNSATPPWTWPVAGDGVSQRDGNKIRLSYAKVLYHFWGMTGMESTNKLNMYVIKQIGVNPAFIIGQCFNSNQAQSDLNSATIYDDSIFRNPVFTKSYKIIQSKTVYMKPNPDATQPPALTTSLYIPLNKVATFNGGTGDPQNCLYTVLITSNFGNRNTTTNSTLLGIPQNNMSTGILFNYSARLVYKDI